MRRLTLGQNMWSSLRQHLLSDDCEHLAFILAEPTQTNDDLSLLGRELVLIPDEDLENPTSWDSLILKLEPLLEVMNRANRTKCILVEAHSHPFSKDHVEFSRVDLTGQQEMVSHLREVLPGSAYLALVLGQESVKGLCWLPNEQKPVALEEIRIIGSTITRVCSQENSWKNNRSTIDMTSNSTHHRQILALGAEGQQAIQRSKIAIVGLGGIGSIVAQQLAHLGVREFVLIDDDVVEVTNLHRLVAATQSDVGLPKVEVAEAHLKAVNPQGHVLSLRMNARANTALKSLQNCDVIFGCVDTDAGRLILNELCNAYLIPYIDCGVGINVLKGEIAEAGGRVVVWTPGRPCLLCSKEINPRIAAEELESQQEVEYRKQHGYVAGANLPEPAVISLNGTIASLAVTEFLALVTGFRDSRHYCYYDLLEQRVGQRNVKKDDRCIACALQGFGDRANVERFERIGLPTDIPAK
jgi:molybdopterin/thiamine biosynthesis adenylyltransferase